MPYDELVHSLLKTLTVHILSKYCTLDIENYNLMMSLALHNNAQSITAKQNRCVNQRF